MAKAVGVLAALGLMTAAAAAQGQVSGQPLTVSVTRFYSPASATTTIEGACELQLGALAAGAGVSVRYRVEVAIQDSSGLVLQHSDWSRVVPASVAGRAGATSVETFEFRAAPGLYRVVVRVSPESGSILERAVAVRAFGSPPHLSDVLLATGARTAADSGASELAGEVRRGGLILRTAPLPRLTPAATALAYYAEAYLWPGAALDGQLSVAVMDSARHTVVQTPTRPVRFSQVGGVTRGSLDLMGLPPGRYALAVRVALGDSVLAGEAPFVMGASGGAEMVADSAPSAPRDLFAGATEAVLDSLYAPLVYLQERSERGTYEQLSVEGKRRFLQEFWARRDPTHGSGANTAMVQYYRAVAFANQTFREGGAGQVAGWRTDRGRIYLRNGRWDEILQRPVVAPKPYEVWKYTRGRPRYYIFLDQSGVGHFQLIASNDRREQGLPDWQTLLGATENYDDVARFIGLTQDQDQQP